MAERDGQRLAEAANLFVLSFRHRAALAEATGALGRLTVAARRAAGAASRFHASGAGIAVVDLRKADAGEIAASVAFAEEVASTGGALIVIADDAATLDAMIARGATHELATPFDAAALDRAIRMAERYVARTGRGFRSMALGPLPALRDDARDPRADIGEVLAAGASGALLLIALSRFEMINTAFGRGTGDALLEAVAGRIEALAEALDGGEPIVGRLSGAEFVVMLNGVQALHAVALAERIVDRIERPFLVGGHLVSVACCIGLAETVADDDATSLLRRASVALARARAEGQSVHSLSAADEGAALFDASLETDLRRALDAGEIEILFQPQVSVTTGAVVGVEALARWRHPRHGELGAMTLFAVAERSNYLGALSAHVQRRAADSAAGWPAALAHLRLSINLTAADLARPGFVDSFLAMIDSSGFPRARLTVEITETELIEDLEAAALLLAGLRAGGCRVAIDDFGTGYSSLAYLKALPLDYLKIDKHLAQDITGTTRDRIVVRGVIDMARSLGLSVIAEGVETHEQLALLAAEGCQFYQGFLCAEPLATDALIALVERAA